MFRRESNVGFYERDNYMETDYDYPKNSLIFNITKYNQEDRKDDVVRQTISFNFLKDYTLDPLFMQANGEPDVFKIFFKTCQDCYLHSDYVQFLKKKELEQFEAE